LLENAKEALALYFEDYRGKATPLPQGAAPEEMVFVEIDEGEIDQLVQPTHKLEAR
jgi:predicted RNase H-like HicB family nuclease